MRRRILFSSVLVASFLFLPALPAGADLLVGAASVDITPRLPVALCGQFHLRIARTVETPLAAHAIVLEARNGDQTTDMAVMVSCDVVYIPKELLAQVRDEVHKRVPEIDVQKIFLNGTHTHTAPVLLDGKYPIPEHGVTQPGEYRRFFAERVAEAIANAWKGRTAGAVSWGLGHAVVAYNRRAVYANGTARMYGPTNVPEFRGLEGYEDHDIGALFVWNDKATLIALAVNVSCPSQEVEGRTAVNADFWHPVRERLKQRYGEHLCVLGWTGAAGDQSPHLMYRRAADQRMCRLRGLTRMEEIARRIARAVDEAYEAVKDDRHADAALIHRVETIRLPMRLVTESEYKAAKAMCDQYKAQIEQNPKAAARVYRRMQWYQVTVDRFEKQKEDPHPTYEMELHVVRIGDAVVCTNAFELFTDFGIQMKARSKAVQTFIIQLAGPGTYVPTERAVRGGHYSAIVESNLVGPEGGQVLVERTVQLINSMWE